jgi:predicted Zn-dependent protease
MLSKDQAKQLATKVLSFSKFPGCDVTLTYTEKVFVRFALNGITTSGFTVEQLMDIESSREGRTGRATVAEFNEPSLRAAVEQSERTAAMAPPNPERVPPLEPQKYPSIENVAESTVRARVKDLIPHIRAVIEAAEEKGLVSAGFFEREAGASAVANKQGNFGFGRATNARLSTTIRNAHGSSSGWASQSAVRMEDIDGAALARIAVEKCLRWTNPKRFHPGKYTVVLEPTAVGDLLPVLGFSFSARAAEEGRTFLSKKGGGTLAGEKLLPQEITLRSDPQHRLFSVLPFSMSPDGPLPVAPITWIDQGIVNNLFYDRYWASKTEKQPTTPPVHLVLEGGDKSIADLIASVEFGLLVTRFWYVRMVNPQTVQLTGITRDGLFLIEKGKITAPVMNFRFNDSPVRMLQNASAIGRPIRVQGAEGPSMIAPPLVCEKFTFPSVSDAI